MKKAFLILCALSTTAATAGVPDVGYVSDFLESKCHNPNFTVPGAGVTHLMSQRYLLELIDTLNNGETSYAADLITEPAIVSIGYLNDSLNILGEPDGCCRGGAVNLENNECETCQVWAIGDNACPPAATAIDLGVFVITDANESCPAGMESYFHIPDHCTDHIY